MGSPSVPFFQIDFKDKMTSSHVFELEGNSLLGFVSPFLDFCDLRGVKLFSIFREYTGVYGGFVNGERTQGRNWRRQKTPTAGLSSSGR